MTRREAIREQASRGELDAEIIDFVLGDEKLTAQFVVDQLCREQAAADERRADEARVEWEEDE